MSKHNLEDEMKKTLLLTVLTWVAFLNFNPALGQQIAQDVHLNVQTAARIGVPYSWFQSKIDRSGLYTSIEIELEEGSLLTENSTIPDGTRISEIRLETNNGAELSAWNCKVKNERIHCLEGDNEALKFLRTING